MPKNFIHYSCQNIEDSDVDAVVHVLRSDWLTQGPDIENFEQSVIDFCEADYGIAVSNATAGLQLSCMALGVGAGDLVWTTPMSFVASANCARYLDAEVDFVDIDLDTGNICVAALKEKLEKAKFLPKVIIPVHYSGRPCDMEAISQLKNRFGFKIIEDAAHALGANYENRTPVGSNKESAATVFSFHPVKPITTGEGGMIVTHNKELADKVRSLRSHGIVRGFKDQPAWYWEQQELGYNFRMTDFQATLGTSQMKRLSKFIDRRRELARRYRQLLPNIVLPPASDNSGWHLYVVQLENRDEIFKKLRSANIGVNVHYIPIHLHPYYRELGFKTGQFPAAEKFYSRCLSLPLHQGLSDADQDYVVQLLKALIV